MVLQLAQQFVGVLVWLEERIGILVIGAPELHVGLELLCPWSGILCDTSMQDRRLEL